MKTQYFYIDGEMVGYADDGGHKDVLTDALGSVTGEVDQAGDLTYSARYSPLGDKISETGSSTSGFGWIGSHGYRETGLAHASHYVRERHYSDEVGAWTTVDPLWPWEAAYVYVDGKVTVAIDPTGTAPCEPPDDCSKCTCDSLRATITDPHLRQIASFTMCCTTTKACTPCIAVRDGESKGSVSYKCVVAHETRHCEDWLAGKNSVICNGNPCGGVANTNMGKAECPAFFRTITCNWNGMNKNPCKNANSWECIDIKNSCQYISGQKNYPPGSKTSFKCNPIPDDIRTICKKVGINV